MCKQKKSDTETVNFFSTVRMEGFPSKRCMIDDHSYIAITDSVMSSVNFNRQMTPAIGIEAESPQLAKESARPRGLAANSPATRLHAIVTRRQANGGIAKAIRLLL